MFTVFAATCVLFSQGSWTPARVMTERHLDRYEPEIVAWFGGEARLKQGADAKEDELSVAWAIEAPGAKEVVVQSEQEYQPRVEGDVPGKGHVVLGGVPYELKLKRVGKNGLFVGAATLAEGDGFRWHYVADGQPVGAWHNLEVYSTPPEATPDPSIPAGKLEQQAPLESNIFGGTLHDWWIYTPANYDPSQESNLVVFQDGQWSHSYVAPYFDHLIAKHELPQTIVVCVTPGTFPDKRSDRSREYDTLNDSYVRFLLEELLPPVEAKYKITQDPMRRCVAGISSGGICAFTAAWQRPDKFGLVMSWVGSFTNIASGPTMQEGGHNYPALIRKTPHKPIRVFLQDGANDLDNEHGNWPLSNKQMALALQFAKYDLKTVWGHGFHSDRQGRATMADALRWLFRR